MPIMQAVKVGLAACPFCGSTTTKIIKPYVDRYAVACGQCEATGPLQRRKRDALDGWNHAGQRQAGAATVAR